MTPNQASTRTNFKDAMDSRSEESSPRTTPLADRTMPEYPRIAEVLQRLRTQPERTTQTVDAELARMARGGYSAIVGASVTSQLPSEILQVVQAEEIEPVRIDTPYAIAGAQAAIDVPPMPKVPDFRADAITDMFAGVDDVVELVDAERESIEVLDLTFVDAATQLRLKHLAREAVRARFVAWARSQRQRSTYELVFLMLSFSVMVLLCVPPLIQLAHAINGTTAH